MGQITRLEPRSVDVESSHSVTRWLDQLKEGDSGASQLLWERYIHQLLRLARHKLRNANRRVADEEDLAISAFAGFFKGVREGRFPKLADRDDLWQVLLVLTERKAIDQHRHDGAKKRNEGKVRGESALDAGDSAAPGIAGIIDDQPTPEFAAEMTDQLRLRLSQLGDVERQIALGKLESKTNKELAKELGISLRAVERKLGLMRDQWQDACEHE